MGGGQGTGEGGDRVPWWWVGVWGSRSRRGGTKDEKEEQERTNEKKGGEGGGMEGNRACAEIATLTAIAPAVWR